MIASDDAKLGEEPDAMRTTVTLDDATVAKAAELTGIEETSALVRAGLETLIRVESARRLAALGGTDKTAATAPRRRRTA
jgi:Arc/MetJ family transcription regulator